MKLNTNLFLELCKAYNVPLSQDYSGIMFEDEDGTVRPFRDEDIDRIFASEDEKAKFCNRCSRCYGQKQYWRA